jgi:hypothetical protein
MREKTPNKAFGNAVNKSPHLSLVFICRVFIGSAPLVPNQRDAGVG